jgi:hypothetical protein
MTPKISILPKKLQITSLQIEKMNTSKIRMKMILGYASALCVSKSEMIGNFDVIVN